MLSFKILDQFQPNSAQRILGKMEFNFFTNKAPHPS